MQKSIWIFGGIAGLLCALLEFLFFNSTEGSANVMYATKLVVLIICIAFGLVWIRKQLGGTISIARTLMSGIMISLVRAIIMIASFTFLYYPSGEFYESKLQESFSQAEKKIAADEEIKPADKEMILSQTKEQIATQYEPQGYMLITIGMSLVTGLIFTVLMAAFISTNLMYKT